MSRIDHPSVQRVQAALDEAGITAEIRILPEAAPTAKALPIRSASRSERSRTA